MKKLATILAVGGLILGGGSVAEATTWTVVRSGGGDYTTIQAAIDNALTVPGDTISVAPGTYYEHLTISKPNITLTGQNKQTTIIDATQDPSWTVAKAGILIGEYPYSDGVSNVTVSGFTIQNAALQTGGDPFEGDKYGVGPGGLTGIQIYNSSNNTIEDNILVNNYRQAWVVAEWSAAGYSECRDNVICNNVIRDSTEDGVYLYSDGTVAVEDTLIKGNEIFNLTGDYTSGVEFWGWDEGGDPAITGTIVAENDIYDCTYGVRIKSGVEDISGTKVNNNNIFDNTTGLQNYLISTVNAKCNWWGDAGGPGVGGANGVVGQVDVSTWLDAPYPGGNCIPEPATMGLLALGGLGVLLKRGSR